MFQCQTSLFSSSGFFKMPNFVLFGSNITVLTHDSTALHGTAHYCVNCVYFFLHSPSAENASGEGVRRHTGTLFGCDTVWLIVRLTEWVYFYTLNKALCSDGVSTSHPNTVSWDLQLRCMPLSGTLRGLSGAFHLLSRQVNILSWRGGEALESSGHRDGLRGTHPPTSPAPLPWCTWPIWHRAGLTGCSGLR